MKLKKKVKLCRAKTQSGHGCTKKVVINGLCLVHYHISIARGLKGDDNDGKSRIRLQSKKKD